MNEPGPRGDGCGFRGAGSNDCVNIHSFSHSFIYPSFKAWQALLKVLRIYRFLPLGYLIPPPLTQPSSWEPSLSTKAYPSVPQLSGNTEELPGGGARTGYLGSSGSCTVPGSEKPEGVGRMNGRQKAGTKAWQILHPTPRLSCNAKGHSLSTFWVLALRNQPQVLPSAHSWLRSPL